VASKVKIEMSNFKIVLGVLVLGTFATAVHAECIVADPTPTLLNARSAPYGRIIGTLDNGQLVSGLRGRRGRNTDRLGLQVVYRLQG
jgi:hypothetical protein